MPLKEKPDHPIQCDYSTVPPDPIETVREALRKGEADIVYARWDERSNLWMVTIKPSQDGSLVGFVAPKVGSS